MATTTHSSSSMTSSTPTPPLPLPQNTTTSTQPPRKNALPFLKDISPTLPFHQEATTPRIHKGLPPPPPTTTQWMPSSSSSSSLNHSSTSTSPLDVSSPTIYTSTKVVRISSQQQQQQQQQPNSSMMMTSSHQEMNVNRNRRSSSMSSTISRSSNMTTSTMTSAAGSSMSDTDVIPGPQSSITKKRKTRCCRSIDRLEICKYFSIKEEEAAKEMNISKSKLKRVKKEMGISRWPYRRLEALNQELKEVRELIHASQESDVNGGHCANASSSSETSQVTNLTQLCQQEKILQQSIDLIYQMPNIIVNQSNENIKEICFKTQRISLNNLLNL
ncbi:hypothetical protein FDP41_012352 [Naegleria fowleri]|uniref:RWP-RK domain-containing protein n=1 Tax=Naegleria fowleri TaxID=5763 RepID=A0A6A5C8H6_NAEFO|nr:uncharacterized protein FDP41_012352 [Naegleria fowleri]KAF0981695.1 hypothetical protein FDP41_012352 [Naegleria fowleri]